MRKLKLRAAVVAVAALATFGSMTIGADAATDGPSSPSTPGLYAWPASEPNYTQLQFYTKVTNDPTPGVNNGANVFWAHQFSSSNTSASGYIGFQTPKDANGNRQVLFSVWGATACTLGDSAYGPKCVSNTDGDPGAGARIYYPWKAGVKYRFTVRKDLSRPGWWRGYFYDPTTNVNHLIGELQFGGGGSSDMVYPYGDFVEYYNWNDSSATCGEQLDSAGVFYPITGDGGTVKYTSTSHSSTCTYADHSAILSDGSANMVATPQDGVVAPTSSSLTASSTSVTNGSSITFNYATPASTNSASNWIGVYKQGQTPGNVYSLTWQRAGGLTGSDTFTANWGPGTYQVYYLYNDGYQVLSGPITITVS